MLLSTFIYVLLEGRTRFELVTAGFEDQNSSTELTTRIVIMRQIPLFVNLNEIHDDSQHLVLLTTLHQNRSIT